MGSPLLLLLQVALFGLENSEQAQPGTQGRHCRQPVLFQHGASDHNRLCACCCHCAASRSTPVLFVPMAAAPPADC
ncbi:hypothetical protein V8C86DRAFT_2648138 [Haematococcus lacustris]